MSERPATCLATRCVICHDHAHRLGEICPPADRCSVRAVSLGMACRRCHDRMASQLREIPELYALAGGELGTGSGGSSSRSTEPSLGLRVAALDLRQGADVLVKLGMWQREWSEFFEAPIVSWAKHSRSDSDPTGQTIVDLCARLGADLHRVCAAHPAIDDFAKELNAIHSAARTAARTTGRRHTVVDCPADQPERGICGAPLRITSLELTDVVYCRRCSTRWEVHRLLLVTAADAEAGVWLAVEDAAMLYGVHQRTLRKWAKAERIVRLNGLYEAGSIRLAIHDGTARDAGVSA